MDTSRFAIAIMAAGKGTRLKSKRPKVLHQVGGRALLLHVIAAAEAVVPADQVLCIVGHEADRVRAAVQSTGVRFVNQTEQKGTGHALQQVKAYFETGDGQSDRPEHLVVLSGDVPLIRSETIRQLCAVHRQEDAAMTILTAVPPDPTGYGRVLRAAPGSAEVLAIVEQRSLTPEQKDAPEINSGIYCFRVEALFPKLDLLSPDNAQRELYLTDVAALLRRDGEKVVAVQAGDVDEVLGANTIQEMMHLDQAMRMGKAKQLMANGVTIFRPDTCVIDADVQVGADTVVEPFVQLLGSTTIGSECTLRSYSVVRDSQLGDGVLLRNGCVLDRAEIADNAVLGPYAHLRPESRVGKGAHVGTFCETKKVRIGAGSKANHLSYLGDAVIGERVNVGAGTITCNFDGVDKHVTTIEDGAFVGSDSTLVAPVSVGPRAYIAASSCITDNVPGGALALGRSRQITKPGWADERRTRLKTRAERNSENKSTET